MRVTKSIVLCIAGLLVLVVCNLEAAERKFMKARVEPGGEVLVSNHKNFDKVCQPLPVPTIKITRHPSNGTVDVREGTFVIKDSWHPDAERTCRGKSVPGVGVYYRANQTFRGVDTFEYKLIAGYIGRANEISYMVEVQVTVK